jgi:hypothetical protein
MIHALNEFYFLESRQLLKTVILKPMKSISNKLILLSFSALLLQGCVAFPPLVQVEHKHAPPAPANDEVIRRLDAIDQRLSALEKPDGTQAR